MANSLITADWLAKEAARLYILWSVSGSMPQPMRVEIDNGRFVAEVRCEEYPAAALVTLYLAYDVLFEDFDSIRVELRQLILPILRERRDYRCSIRQRVLGSMRVKGLNELTTPIPAERPLLHG